GVERRQGRVRVVHDQRDLGAAEDDGVAALAFHARDDLLEVGDGGPRENTVNEFRHDDAIDLVAFLWGRTDVVQPARGELLRIDVALHEPARSGQAQPPEAPLGGVCRHDFRYMEPWQWGPWGNV